MNLFGQNVWYYIVDNKGYECSSEMIDKEEAKALKRSMDERRPLVSPHQIKEYIEHLPPADYKLTEEEKLLHPNLAAFLEERQHEQT